MIAIVQGGESFAEAAAFESGAYPVSASIIDDARLLVVPAQPFIDKALDDRRLAIKMLKAMSCHFFDFANFSGRGGCSWPLTAIVAPGSMR